MLFKELLSKQVKVTGKNYRLPLSSRVLATVVACMAHRFGVDTLLFQRGYAAVSAWKRWECSLFALPFQRG